HSPVCSFFVLSLPSTSTLFPYTTLFRSRGIENLEVGLERPQYARVRGRQVDVASPNPRPLPLDETDHRSRLGIVDDHRIEVVPRSEEHTSELQSRENLVCRLLLEKKNIL